jgi:hypothetical protein
MACHILIEVWKALGEIFSGGFSLKPHSSLDFTVLQSNIVGDVLAKGCNVSQIVHQVLANDNIEWSKS